jgi:predicted transposase/invertase (TIGR01784 family)
MNSSADAHYKLLFSHSQAIRGLLTDFAPGPWLQEADFTTLERVNASYVSEDEKQRHDDVVWRVKVSGHWFWIYVVLELQSKPDPWMALRMMVYVGLLAQHLIREDPTTDRLPPILPIVLYNGQRVWRAPLNVADCFIEPPGSLKPYLPHLQYHLIDELRLNLHPVDEVRNVTRAIFALETSRSYGDVLTLLHTLKALLATPEMQPLKQSMEKWVKAFLQGNDMTSNIDSIPDIFEGEGMIAERVQSWFKQARLEGLQEGELRGQQIGEANVLSRLLARRFGPLPNWAEARLRAADAGRLEKWADAVLDAASLTDVLGSPDQH